MERANPFVLIVGLLAMYLVFAGPGWFMTGVYLAKHEGDAVHLLDIVMRMAAGEVPHVDFMTPIGGMAFWPIVWFMGPHTGAGHAFVYAQMAVLAALLPAIFWIGVTRLSTWQALGFGLAVTVLVVAFVHGESEPTLALSMHYNRWAWAVAFVAIAIAILPPRELSIPLIDGALIGIAMALLVLTKVTYVVGFAPAVLVALIGRRDWTALVSAVVVGLATLALFTLPYGLHYWAAYVNDVLSVARSDVRPNPGRSFGLTLSGPAYLGASIVVLLSVVALRRAQQMQAGLILLLLVPGFFYVTYQNFGNDPQWLYLLPVLLFALRPESEHRDASGLEMRHAVTILSVVSMALAAPSFFNLAYSPFRHLSADKSRYSALIPGDRLNSDIYTTTVRAYGVKERWNMLEKADSPFASFKSLFDKAREDAEQQAEDKDPRKQKGLDDPVQILGETFPNCDVSDGLMGYFDAVAKELEKAGYAGKRVLNADIFSTINWVYGDFPPLEGGAPWSYGSAAGLQNAEYFLVPFCPLHPPTRKLIVDAVLAEPQYTLTYETRTPLFVLYRVTGS